ncbi:PREDICTED: G-type lectin S-receptor-like serine/threonine-protein kinase At4g27290 isoform X2 [Ipomoea nil]|uniref:G-type lectin S-receptor-like serine/threonine-protein kinase At4g27290 isoform X2 n=1 Tax=Ipomoea nil TaxID=35883 RepID=UPI0009015EDE|nr:PREDICTED: G-type lectin S-receptor-like serine/threonine-protein kinase At4g27290 isoform X2 [Ipomoea nil]
MRIGFLHNFLFSLFLLLSSMHNIISQARDTITPTQSLRDGETIISSGGHFEMGFLSSPEGSLNRYISIWYKQIPVPTLIWIANTQTALTNTTSAVFKIIKPGLLLLTDAKLGTIWSTKNTTSRSAKNPIAQLLDSGNLVVRDAEDENPENFIWQSFDYPTDTFFPGMKLGWNFLTGHEVFLTARENENSPASGQFTAHLDPTGYPQIVIKNGTEEVYATGPWNGLRWSGKPAINPDNPHFKYQMHMNPREAYTRYDIVNNSIYLRLVLSSSGVFESLGWVNETQSWFSFIKSPMDICDKYAVCGVNGICNLAKSPICGCLENFVNKTGGAGGCHRRKALKCKNGTDGFKKYSGIKLPDTKHSWFNKTMNLKECEHKCLKNCSCTAYSSLDISKGGSGCLLWFNGLFGVRVLTQNGQDIYIRLDSSEIPGGSHPSSKGKKVKIIFGSSLLLTIILILLGLSLGFYFYKKSNKKERKMKESIDIPLFDLSTILRATNNFSNKNKLGKGGFGAVYKGVLENKQEIAVKRLSKNSTQGVEEFKNEVICIAKLQHRNLVKLLGCCIQGEEKLLVYEYMANTSLDTFIFDETKSKLLDWPKRFSIIIGIARGLLYLHQDSRLRIIHRDLKANNVLLDNMMNPKISDFGLARSVLGDATEANTNRIVGTHGYIAPEYAGDGIFSVKSDTFSFGVLLLEIVTSKRNRGFRHPNNSLNLISHVWKLYKENRELELIDEHLAPSCDLSQAQRSIQVGLLCVQQHPEDRPIMSSVVIMLSNDSTLPEAKEPGFFTERRASESNYSSSTQGESSRNECSISLLDPR